MADFRYRAYISYSHNDEHWAAWLHSALESYQVPRHLVANKTSVGEVPKRIRPVFRDRDDLSSATDLKGTVKQALSDSENLIVVCSPEAAASHWVNEEIRQFAGLGRADRIFCIIVNGEPAADGSVSGCFPAALAEVGMPEPLAADLRKWADGKHVAKLKLIAGLLGIRLDDLRQRDLQRRRKRQFLAGLSAVAVLTLATMTVVSQISEQHERDKAEQLATFIVDLGERLKSDADLETLSLISAEASQHLQSLDPEKLSPETGGKVALALRQMARVSELQGKPNEALAAFQRSRDLLSDLHKKFPESSGLLFELGNAEFYVGNLHNRQGQYESALESMQNYHRLTGKLLSTDSDNPDWMLELAYSHNNLAALQLANGKGMNQATLDHVEEALTLMERVVSLKPGDLAVTDVYTNTLAWAADAQVQACQLNEAMTIREKAVGLAKYSTQNDPANNDLKKHYAFALTGVARLQTVTGKSETAKQNIEMAISILQQLSAADLSNVHYQKLVLGRQVMLLKLLTDTGQLESASLLIDKLGPEFESVGDLADQDQGGDFQKYYIEFLLASADIEFQVGNLESANQYLQIAIRQQLERADSNEKDIFEAYRLVRARYQMWKLNGVDDIDHFLIMPQLKQASSNSFRSCMEADTAARIYVMEGDRASAASQVQYLQSRGYADPGFVRFCERFDLCKS
jgi:tetratricopeptide (TPR) repeat protein